MQPTPDFGALSQLTDEQRNAVVAFREQHGRNWKEKLGSLWLSPRSQGHLHVVRNTLGPEWLQSVREADFKAVAKAAEKAEHAAPSDITHPVRGEQNLHDHITLPDGRCVHVLSTFLPSSVLNKIAISNAIEAAPLIKEGDFFSFEQERDGRHQQVLAEVVEVDQGSGIVRACVEAKDGRTEELTLGAMDKRIVGLVKQNASRFYAQRFPLVEVSSATHEDWSNARKDDWPHLYPDCGHLQTEIWVLDSGNAAVHERALRIAEQLLRENTISISAEEMKGLAIRVGRRHEVVAEGGVLITREENNRYDVERMISEFHSMFCLADLQEYTHDELARYVREGAGLDVQILNRVNQHTDLFIDYKLGAHEYTHYVDAATIKATNETRTSLAEWRGKDIASVQSALQPKQAFIAANEADAVLLESLGGVSLGKYDAQKGGFPAKLESDAINCLAEFEADFAVTILSEDGPKLPSVSQPRIEELDHCGRLSAPEPF